MSTTKKINARIKLKGETSENWAKSDFIPIKNEMLLVHDKGNAIVITEDDNAKSVATLIQDPPYFFPILKGQGKYSVIEGRDTPWEYSETKIQTVKGAAKVNDIDFYGSTHIFTITLTSIIPEETLSKITHIKYDTECSYTPDNELPMIMDVATVQGTVLHAETNEEYTTLLCEVQYPIYPLDSSYYHPINTWKEEVTLDLYAIIMRVIGTRGNAADSASSHSEGLKNVIGYASTAAHAEGVHNSIENAEAAHIEGKNNTIIGSSSTTGGNAAHVEGQNNRLQGNKSHGAHIEGGSNYGSGQYIHIEGAGNHATRDRAHAEGYQTRAEGDQSHTEGLRTTTKHSAAHAEGVDTIAWGRGSHVEGNTTVALTAHSHAEGEHTLAGAKGYYWEAIEFTKDAEDVITGGTIYLCAEQLPKGEFPNIGTGKRYDNLVPGYAIGDTIAIINKEHFYTNAKITAIDHNIITYEGDIGFTEIQTPAEEEDSRDIDEYSMWVVTTPDPLKTEGTIYASALNTNAHAEGLATQALGEGAHSEGGACIAYGDFAHAEGKYTKASYSAHAEGEGTKALGHYSHAEGSNTEASGNGSHTEGAGTKATNYYAHVEGENSTAAGRAAHAEGGGTNANGDYSHAEGIYTVAKGSGAHAEGKSASASGEGAHAEGVGGSGNHVSARSDKKVYQYTSQASGKAMHVEGSGCEAKGREGNHAEGRFTKAIGEWSCHAEGYLSRATANHAHAEGFDTEAGGQASHAEGRFNIVSDKHTASHVQGEGNVTTAAHQFLGGKYSDPQTDTLVAFGWGSGENGIATTKKNALELKTDGTLIVNALQIGGVNILPITGVEFPGGDE